MLMFATSLPGGNPSGTLLKSPKSPPEDAMVSMLGVFAYSRGVLPPNSAMGSSAIPSPMSSAYFIKISPVPFVFICKLESHCLYYFLHVRRHAQGFRRHAYRRVRVCKAVPRESANDRIAVVQHALLLHLYYSGEGGRRGRLAKNPFFGSDQLITLKYLF